MGAKKLQARENIPQKFMQRTGPLFHIRPEWFRICQRRFLRSFRFLSSLFSDTREKCFFLAASASGRRFPPHARKKLLVPRVPEWPYLLVGGENPQPELETMTSLETDSQLLRKNKVKYIKICDFIVYKHSWVFSSLILGEDNKKFRDFLGIDLH